MNSQLQKLFLRLASALRSLIAVERKNVIQYNGTIPVGGTQEFNVKTLMGADWASYDMTRVLIDVRVLDTDAASPTNGYFVGADAVCATGFKPTGEIRIANLYENPVNVWITVDIPKIPGV